MTKCPDVSALSAPEDHSDEIRAHLAECEVCAALVTLAAANGDDAVGDMTDLCLEVEPLIAARVDSRLDDADRELLSSHLDECERCAAVAATVWLDDDIDDVLDPLVAPRPVVVPIEVGRAVRADPPPPYRRPIVIAAALAAAAALVLGVWWSRQTARQTAEREADQVESVANATDGEAVPAAGRSAPDKNKKAPAPIKKPPKKKRPAPKRDARTVTQEEARKALVHDRIPKQQLQRWRTFTAKLIFKCRKRHKFDRRVEISFIVNELGRVADINMNLSGKMNKCVRQKLMYLPFPKLKTRQAVTWKFEPPRTEGAVADNESAHEGDGKRAGDRDRRKTKLDDKAEREKQYKTALTDARSSAKSARFGRAMRMCEKALALKKTSDATMVCAISACNLASKSKARKYYHRIRSKGRQNMIRQICLRNGVKLD